jgi:ATP-dependent RNA helicase RhlE
MGRQVLWGGKGRPPSREVLNAAAKAARSEMMQRIRENKDKQALRRRPARRQRRVPPGRGQWPAGPPGAAATARAGPQQPQQPQQQAARPPRQNGARNGNAQPRAPRREDEEQPRLGAHESRSPFVVREAPAQHNQSNGQPDPLRTSVDSMGRGGRRGGRPDRSRGNGNGRPGALRPLRPA